MSSYLRSWLPTLSLRQSTPVTQEQEQEEESPTTPTNPSFSIQSPNDDDDDDDAPPAFPAIASAQRISSTLMPPPSIPAPRRRIPGPSAPSSSSSASSSLMPPPSTTRPPTQLSKSKKRAKVVLTPGHSPLDWAALKSSGADLRVMSFVFLFYCNLHCLLAMFRVERRPWHAYPRRYCACTINVMMRGLRLTARFTISRLT
jgi:N-acetylmuramoyl-L-alanine amidase